MSDEPAEALGLTGTPRVLVRPPTSARRTPVRPSERKRRKRVLLTTFSTPEIPDRVRALAERWELYTASGQPSASAVIEHLLLPQLEKAERGEIVAPAVRRRGDLWL